MGEWYSEVQFPLSHHRNIASATQLELKFLKFEFVQFSDVQLMQLVIKE